MHIANARKSVRSIQVRLFMLLLRAFGIVVLLMVIFLLALTGIFIIYPRNNNPFGLSPLAASLESYYLAHGNWQGVERIYTGRTLSPLAELPPRWGRSLLLDGDGRVVVDHGLTGTSLIGTVYQVQSGDESLPLSVQGIQVGALVYQTNESPAPGRTALRFLQPLVNISVVPAVLTLIIGLFLMRRVVNPLANVISAAQSVAAGDLSTRVQSSGPDDLRALSDSFNQMAESLQSSDRKRRDMLADIAHELRTPLSVMRGRMEGIVDGIYPVDESQIALVLEETYLVERLVEDLRILTLAESRQLHLEQRPVDLGELAKRAASLFEAEAAEKGFRFSLDIQPDLPMVSGDAQRLEQVISNLVGNALRYTPDGGQINIQVDLIPDAVRVRVSDTGPGVPEEDLPHIFDRFWRGDKSRSRAAGGAGLGLAIARQLVEAQGGAIRASNLPGGGLEVTFSLPLQPEIA